MSNKIALSQVKQICEKNKLNLTQIREDVYNIVLSSDKPIKAYDVLEKLKGKYSNPKPPTAYRALDFLVEHGFLHKLEKNSSYIVCYHPQTHKNCYFLLCIHCDKTIECCNHTLDKKITEITNKQGFLALNNMVEIEGLCAECR